MIRPQSRSRRAALALLSASLLGLALPVTAPAADEKKDDSPRPIRALLVIGGGCHDYAKQKGLLTRGISARADVVWTVAYDPDRGTGHKNPVYDNPDWAKAR